MMTNQEILNLYHSLVRKQRVVMDTIDTCIFLYGEKEDSSTMHNLGKALVTLNRRLHDAHVKFPWLATYYDNYFNEKYF